MSDEENRETCFVITPIGEPNSDIRRHILYKREILYLK